MDKIKPATNLDEVRLVHLSDPHMCAQSPPSWKLDYLEHTEKVLDQVFTFAENQKVDAILWSGDIFHRKSPASNPLHFVTRVTRLLRRVEEKGIQNWGVAGNHDLKWGCLEGLRGQPIDQLVASGVLRLLDEDELIVQANGFCVRVAGGSYDHGKAEHVRKKARGGCDRLVSLGHFWFGQETGTMFGEPAFGPDYLGQSEVDIYCIGHHHDDQGVQNIQGKWYVVHGSINRTGGRPQDLVRRPAAGYIVCSKEDVRITVLRPNVPPAEEVIDLGVRAQIIEERKEMEEFICSLHATKVEEVDPVAILGELDAAVEVKQRAQMYLDVAEESLR